MKMIWTVYLDLSSAIIFRWRVAWPWSPRQGVNWQRELFHSIIFSEIRTWSIFEDRTIESVSTGFEIFVRAQKVKSTCGIFLKRKKKKEKGIRRGRPHDSFIRYRDRSTRISYLPAISDHLLRPFLPHLPAFFWFCWIYYTYIYTHLYTRARTSNSTCQLIFWWRWD